MMSIIGGPLDVVWTGSMTTAGSILLITIELLFFRILASIVHQ